MNIEYGIEVIDRNDKPLGTVNYVINDMWTGEISKFMVDRKSIEKDLFLSPQDILDTEKAKIKVNISLDELDDVDKKIPRG
jgi:hypothetical protein